LPVNWPGPLAFPDCEPGHFVPAVKDTTMKSAIRMCATLVLFTLAGAALAGDQTPRADARQQNQDDRIEQGVASGELTQREAQRLDARQDHIDNVEDRAKADGVVTRKERVTLEVKQDRTSNAIARQKHDRQDRD
jgi:hypothetical protein